MATIDWLQYANQGATRNQPLSPELVSALSFLPELGLSARVFSGGQDADGPNRTGSHRHDHGNAADVFFMKDGRQLSWTDQNDLPVFEDIVRRGREAGITGFGAGDGYMQPGSMHIGFGAPGVWGAGGRGTNAPEWLRMAFDGSVPRAPVRGQPQAPGTPAPAMPPAVEVADRTVAPMAADPRLSGQPAPTAPEGGSGLGALFANLAPAINATQSMADADPVEFSQSGDPMAATVAAAQNAQKAKGLAAGLAPDISALMGLGKRPQRVA